MTVTKAEKGSISLREKVRESAPDIFEAAMWMTASFIAANAFVFGRLAPFGCAAVAASGRKYGIAAVFGAILGTVVSAGEEKLRYTAAIVAAYIIKLVLERFTGGDLFCVLAAGTAAAVSSFGFAALTELSGYTGMMALGETVLAAGAAYFFKRTGVSLERRRPVSSLPSADKACVIMTLAIGAAAFSALTVGSFSVGRIAACIAVLIAADFGKESSGTVTGTAVGAAVGIASSSFEGVLAGFAFGGLIAGVFAYLGKLAGVISFALVKLLFCIVYAQNFPDLTMFYEALIAGAAFMLIPKNAMERILGAASESASAADGATVRELLLNKMGQAAAGLNDISAATRTVAKSVERSENAGLSTVLNEAAEARCSRCSRNGECWQDNYSRTESAFAEMGRAAKQFRKPKLETEFLKACPNTEELCKNIERRYSELAKKNAGERKLRHVRDVVTDQFDGMALLLRDIASEAASVKKTDKKLSAAVKSVFEAVGVPVFSSTCYLSENGCVNIEVSLAKERLKKANVEEITVELSEVCGCDFAVPYINETENVKRLFFRERPLIEPEFGKASISAAGERYCGDSAEQFIDKNGHAQMILSDGMGSGDKAAIDSMMAAGLLSKMVRNGFRFGSAIKLVNSALLLKSEDESLATADAVTMNLYTGRADFYKAGAAPSFVYKKGHSSKVESISLPVGILGGAEYEQNSMLLGAGDIAVLLTDGATAGGEDWVISELRCLAEKPANEIAESLAKTAAERRCDGHTDDITVLVMKLAEA